MINQKRRFVLKSLSLLAALPAVGLSTFVSAHGVASQQAKVKTAITITNLTGKTLTLNKISPVDSSGIKFSVTGLEGKTLMPGGFLTFDVARVGNGSKKAVVDQIEISSDHPEFDGILSVTSSHAQISLV